MAREKIGYRRLYAALGCSIEGREELRTSFSYDSNIQVELYLGPSPRFGVTIIKSDRYIVPEKEAQIFQTQHFKHGQEVGCPYNFFCEIFCWCETEVPDDISLAFRTKKQGSEKALLSKANAKREEFTHIIDLISGVIGLRFHRQFIIKVLGEDPVALHEDGDYRISYSGSWVERLDPIRLSPEGVEALEKMLPRIASANKEAKETGADILHWLMRAWEGRDPVDRFMAFFIPIEMILNSTGSMPQIDFQDKAQTIRKLIAGYSNGGSDDLLCFFNGLIEKQRPTLVQRFALLAERSKLQGWEDDIKAFSGFNKMRNGLLHRGEKSVKDSVQISKDTSVNLQHLTEKYLRYVLFQDVGTSSTKTASDANVAR